MNKDLFEKKRIYVNYNSQISSKLGNEWILGYKLALVLLFAIGSLILFIKMDSWLFPGELISGQKSPLLLNFLAFETYGKQQSNAIILIRFSILYFVFLFSVFKNFSNINDQKERIKQYSVFYGLYLVLSLTSFILFITFIKQPNGLPYNAVEYLKLSLLLVPLVVINVAFEIYKFILKRKSDPVVYKSLVPIIIQTVSQLLLLAFVLINVFVWISYATRNNLFKGSDQKYWAFVELLFNEKSVKNLFMIILVFTLIVFLIIGSNAMKLHKISEKTVYQVQEKDKFLLGLVFIFVILIWLCILLFGSKVKYAVLGSEVSYSVKNAVIIILGAIFTALYFVLAYTKVVSTKNPIGLGIRFTIIQLLLWTPFLFSIITLENSNINLINLFVISLFSFATFIHYLISNKSLTKASVFFLVLMFGLKIALLMIFGLNHVLLTHLNHVLVSVPTPISIVKIITITYVSVILVFFAYLSVSLQVTLGIKMFGKKKAS
ncbi:MSC_0624 family F1-like ATPase-associated membrane protein [Mycoplasmopsis edwardii]|nr:hypothetical protein [Mycoplasmopsis edwardii]